MPRRPVASATPNRASSNVSFRDTSILPTPDANHYDNIQQLRRHWKWAVFSQFFYTFAQLLQMPDVKLTDIEDDLACGTALYIPRVMQRLLYTLTQDRKISIDNWQSAMRKQYLRRDPQANPLGVDLPVPSRKESREPTVFSETIPDHEGATRDDESVPHTPLQNAADKEDIKAGASSPTPATDDVEQDNKKEKEAQDHTIKKEEGVIEEGITPQDELKDWLQLPLLAKLDSLHLLTEWQFQNPHRLRQFMKDDGDTAQWRIEPIGYDAKTNAYWLIGPDRLWIQRAPPKPPRPPRNNNRKRKVPSKKAASKASTSKAVIESDSEPEPELEPDTDDEPSTKRRRTTRTTLGRSSRSQGKQTVTPSGRSTRAAKLQANKKLDAQAKELAEYQRQAAFLTSPAKSPPGRVTRQTRSSTDAHATSRRPVGTRASARLRGKGSEDDEWQQVPNEWLQEEAEATGANRSTRRTRASTRAAWHLKGEARSKQIANVETDEEEEDELKQLAEQAGLESDGESSALTELSDELDAKSIGEDAVVEGGEDFEDASIPKANGSPAKSDGGKIFLEKNTTQTAEVYESGAEPEPEHEKNTAEDLQSHLPPDFIEWEAICVTLSEWEDAAEQFEKATHYLEKALYKVLSQNIVPVVTAELREAERKRKIEEAMVHRKRSSRIAMKEVEKEEALLAARKQAEEEEKMARLRRAEARSKKEEEEREKREKAREQRRLEREERERRKQEQKERESAEVDIIAAAPTPAPPANGHTSSRRASNTPNGVHTPDWILDCEICHKSGRNLDDGLPMVCCNGCSRWQHIRCHDLSDRQAGRPQRNWNQGQFYCQSCRPAHSRVVNGNIHQHRPVSHYVYTQAPPQKDLPSPAHRAIYQQPTSDIRYSQYPAYDHNSPYLQQYAHNQAAGTPQTSYPRIQQRPQSGIAFSHYQPEQGGFARTSQLSPLASSSQTWQAGYPTANGPPAQSQSSMQGAQYNPNGMYSGSRVSSPYQFQTPPQQPYNSGIQESTTPMANGSWNHTPNDYFRQGINTSQLSTSQLSAAESLAYLQQSRASSQSWQIGAVQPQQNNVYPPPTVQLPSLAQHQFPPS